MFGIVFIGLLVVQGFFLTQYIRALSRISSVAVDQQRLLGITVLEGRMTSYMLLKDVRFFLCLLTKSYAKCEIKGELKFDLDVARKYLLLQYPVVFLLFLAPTLFN